LGGVIGAGFASGREIVHFFARHGSCAWIAAGMAAAVLSALVMRLPAQMQRMQCASLGALCRARFGDRLGTLCGALFFLLSAFTGGAMLAACAELAALSVNIHHAYAFGLVVSLLLGAFCAMRGLQGLALPGALLCALLPFLLLALVRLPAGETGRMTHVLPHIACLDGVLYGALNAAMLAGMLPLLITQDSRRRRRCVCLFALLFGALLALGVLVCRKHLGAVFHQPLPFVFLSRALGRRGYLLIAACLYAAALSTLCTMLCSMSLMAARISQPLLRMALCCGLCLPPALLGFGRIVQSAYPVLGLLCAALLFLLCLPAPAAHRHVSQKRKEAER